MKIKLLTKTILFSLLVSLVLTILSLSVYLSNGGMGRGLPSSFVYVSKDYTLEPLWNVITMEDSYLRVNFFHLLISYSTWFVIAFLITLLFVGLSSITKNTHHKKIVIKP